MYRAASASSSSYLSPVCAAVRACHSATSRFRCCSTPPSSLLFRCASSAPCGTEPRGGNRHAGW
eukprot:scaffold88507_cov63-Phaeocystis_antarctica.AAC.1